MTKDELRKKLLLRAQNSYGWFVETLRERENRKPQEVMGIMEVIAQKVIDSTNGPVSAALNVWKTYSNKFQTRWAEDGTLIAKDLGMVCVPQLSAGETSLVVGVFLSANAVIFLQAASHEKHLLAAHLLIDASQAAGFWETMRGAAHCRIPDRRMLRLHKTNEYWTFQYNYRKQMTQLAKLGAIARHSRPGGSRDKQKQVQDAWASGKFSSRDVCAEQEGAAIGMSFSAARKALRGTPNPSKT